MEDRIKRTRAVIYVLTAIAVLAVAAAYLALPKGVSSVEVYADGEKAEDTVEMYLGTSAALSFAVQPESFSDRHAQYLVADESIVSVSDDGTMSALKKGETLVTVQVAGAKQNVGVKVKSAVKDIKGLEDSITMTEGYGYTLEPEVVMAVKGLEAPALKFKSADESIATVDEEGYVSAVAPGETTITVSAGGVKKKIQATVNERPAPAPAAKKTGGTKKTTKNTGGDDGGGWEG